MLCGCGCKQELTGKQKRFVSDEHRQRFWSDARRRGAMGPEPKKRSKPHCGNPAVSSRLKKTWYALQTLGHNATTLTIQKITGSMKVSTDLNDLKRAGYPISKAEYVRTTDEGRRIYRYHVLPAQAE